MPLLTAVTDIVVVPFPVAADLLSVAAPISGNLEALTAGTFTIDVKNNAGTIFATLTWTAAGAATISARNVSTIAAGDSLHVNVSSGGTAPLGASVTIWWRSRG